MADLRPVDERLRAILAPYRGRLAVADDGPGGLSLHLPGMADDPNGYVCGVRPGKRYVSFYLMPVYAFPELLESISKGLRSRMQGKSCFNFTVIDERLLSELGGLTARGIARYEEAVAAGAGPFAGPRFAAARASGS